MELPVFEKEEIISWYDGPQSGIRTEKEGQKWLYCVWDWEVDEKGGFTIEMMTRVTEEEAQLLIDSEIGFSEFDFMRRAKEVYEAKFDWVSCALLCFEPAKLPLEG